MKTREGKMTVRVKILKGALIFFVSLIFLAFAQVTKHRVNELYYNMYLLTDEEAEAHCSMALTPHLYCWCYEELDRSCPIEGKTAREN